MKRKKENESIITCRILKSLGRIGVVSFVLLTVLNLHKIQGTSSFFTDSAEVAGNKFTAGYWIPTLSMSVAAPDGEDGEYSTTPCVTLAADIHGESEGIRIYYKFSNDGDPISGGTEYLGTCIEIPDGEPTYFEAQAVNEKNEKWVSNLVSESFIVKTALEPGDVIINEVMWMGSRDANDPSYDGPKDQWVELKNVSGKDLHFRNFYLTYRKDSGSEVKLARITNNRIVKNGEYFLLAKYNKANSAMDVQRDNNEAGSSDAMEDFEYEKFQIKLYADDSKKILLDTAGDGTHKPKKGDEDNFYSMERNSVPANGADYDNWYTCLDASSTALYWDEGRTERGTPGHENLSKKDPTPADYEIDFQELSGGDDLLGLQKVNMPMINQSDDSENVEQDEDGVGDLLENEIENNRDIEFEEIPAESEDDQTAGTEDDKSQTTQSDVTPAQ